MSSPRTRIITLNLGSQSIELADFRAQPPGGLILCRYLAGDVFVEPAGKGITRTIEYFRGRLERGGAGRQDPVGGVSFSDSKSHLTK